MGPVIALALLVYAAGGGITGFVLFLVKDIRDDQNMRRLFDHPPLPPLAEPLLFRHVPAVVTLWPVLALPVALVWLALTAGRVGRDIGALVAEALPKRAPRLEPAYYAPPPEPLTTGTYRAPPTCPRCGQPCSEDKA